MLAPSKILTCPATPPISLWTLKSDNFLYYNCFTSMKNLSVVQPQITPSQCIVPSHRYSILFQNIVTHTQPCSNDIP